MSMDPHSLNESLQLTFTNNIYEPLVSRDKQLGLVPGLATSWKQTARRRCGASSCASGVKFHDGSPLTADDVVFSFNRAAGEGSDMKSYTSSFKEVRKVNDEHGRDRDADALSDPAGCHLARLRDEQEVVRGEQGHDPGGPAQGHREHRLLQGQRHRSRIA